MLGATDMLKEQEFVDQFAAHDCIGSERILRFGVNSQDLLPTLQIGQAKLNLPVQSSWTQ
jgi:hypothetical protein